MNAYERLLLPENLRYAWIKAKRLYRTSDGYVDNGEIAEFELDLERQISRIRTEFVDGNYELEPLRPLPRPKKLVDEEPIDRQYFCVAVRDQVAWIAVANALGPHLDRMMPPWSYGNRIYRPAWYEDDEGSRSKLEIGPYRHASGHLYRKFQHSWPLFRRHVALSARAMVRPILREYLDQSDQLAAASAEAEGLPYLQNGFWQRKSNKEPKVDLFCASLDLKQFYPSINSDAVIAGLLKAIDDSDDASRFRNLLNSMLDFRLDNTGMPRAVSKMVVPEFNEDQVAGIPTGLFVAGFLSNAAMLPVDLDVHERVMTEKSISHFRYVDDHTLISYDFDALCEWVDWYERLLIRHNTGAIVNIEKYAPESFGKWMQVRNAPPTGESESNSEEATEKLRKRALQDTRIDGANPTKLLTKTLGQVSAIAATDFGTLDDNDLNERLKMLEWLLLADIPEHEIRPDTRAAFAAGQIAALAPILIQESDGIVDETRELARLKSVKTKNKSAANALRKEIAQQTASVKQLLAEHEKEETRHLKHCFGLLLQAFQQYPGKARLFFRLHQYCQLTGYKGLSEIGEWIQVARSQGNKNWADYYAALSLQILSGSVLADVRALVNVDSSRADKVAALRHLEDVADIKVRTFLIGEKRAAWFHSMSRREFAVSIHSIVKILEKDDEFVKLGNRLETLAHKCLQISFEEGSREWRKKTGHSAGVWAHRIESAIGLGVTPTAAWHCYETCFSYVAIADRRAARRYPEYLSKRGWDHFLGSKYSLKRSDSGWIRDAIGNQRGRIDAARSSKKPAFKIAARSFDQPRKGFITLTDWTHFVSTNCTPFDPRQSEWTALEVIRQLVSPIAEELDVEIMDLGRLHPNNVLVNTSWKELTLGAAVEPGVTWEAWRGFLKNQGATIELRGRDTSIQDYRYLTNVENDQSENPWERSLAAFGRLLLGMLRLDHGAPSLWNIRGNENVIALPLAFMVQSLPISSPTFLLLAGCLGGRSAETRAIASQPDLFGLSIGIEANDIRFDPPSLKNVNELLNGIENAQQVLEQNQLAVSSHQPRQLIPFRIRDFGAVDAVEDGGDDD